MAKYEIEYDRENTCIGSLSCNAVADKFWNRAADGKAKLANSIYNKKTKKWELIIDEKDFQINQDAADSCPVEAIKLIKLEESGSEAMREQNQQSGQESSSSESTIKNNQ